MRLGPRPHGTSAEVTRQERDWAQVLLPNRATSPSKNISIYLTYIQFLHRYYRDIWTNVWMNIGV